MQTTLLQTRKVIRSGLTYAKKLYYNLHSNKYPYKNIYHCCTQKTASQWFRSLYSDPTFRKYTGFNVYTHMNLLDELYRKQYKKSLPKWDIPTLLYNGHPIKNPLPKRTIGILYIGCHTYLSIPKPVNYKCYFVLRDPRDIVVSAYFSIKYSHSLVGPLLNIRKNVNGLNLTDGIKYSIDLLEREGIFQGQRSWMTSTNGNENIKVFRYEDFARDNYAFLNELFHYLEIKMPEKDFNALYNRNRFEKLSGGRKQDIEDKNSHYRKGMPGDWTNYFDRSVTAYFKQVTGDTLKVLGYPDKHNNC